MSTLTDSEHAGAPPLQPGDRLRRREFERRYQAMSECKKAELIEGVVYMPSPARLRHSRPHGLLMSWIVQYSIGTPGTDYADNATIRLDEENEPQPDAALFIDPAHGGQTHVSDDGYLTGPAELVAEVSLASLALDRGPKLRTFERHGVREYLIWRVEDRLLEWYVLGDGGFILMSNPSDGILRSETFPGLWLDIEAMLRRDGAAVMAALNRGLASDEHGKFAKRLEGRR